MMVVFQKPYALRHIGHLDLMRTMQRALRRSGLPVRYSQGFNPHIKLSFAAPLSVGIAGENEIMDVALEGEVGEEAFADALNRVTPPGMKIVRARVIEDPFPALMGVAAGSRYRIEPEHGAGSLADAVSRLLGMDEYMAVRKTKSGENLCNIRPYIAVLEIGNGALLLTVKNLQSGSLKPAVVMEALYALSDVQPRDYTVTREAILAMDEQNNFIPLEVVSGE